MNYSVAVDRLFTRQLKDWDVARDNYEALQSVETQRLQLGDATVVLQHNPRRRASASASLDDASLARRGCFLCTDKQPARQRALLWGSCYKIQVNPYPIFPRHLTIADQRHLPQRIAGRVGDMLQLATSLPDYVIFYNGPQCGASAPDHQHFQAGSKGLLPLCSELPNATTALLADSDEGFIGYVDSLGRSLFTIETVTERAAERYLLRLLDVMPVPEGAVEPMVNVLCWWDVTEHVWRIVVFPRRKHRPDCYGEGEGHLLLSPASVEMGGLWVVPEASDYAAMDAERVQALYDELCLNRADLEATMKSFVQRWQDQGLEDL